MAIRLKNLIVVCENEAVVELGIYPRLLVYTRWMCIVSKHQTHHENKLEVNVIIRAKGFFKSSKRKTLPKELLVSHILNDPVRKQEEEEEQKHYTFPKIKQKSEL